MRPTSLSTFPHFTERCAAPQNTLTDGASSGGRENVGLTTNSVDALTALEASLLQKLLAEAAARHLSPVRSTYIVEGRPPARRVQPVHALLGLLWAASIAIAALTVKYIDSQAMIASTSDNHVRSLDTLNASLARQSEVFKTIVGSLQQLTGALTLRAADRIDTPSRLPYPSGSQLGQTHQPATVTPPGLVAQPAMPVLVTPSPQPADTAPIPLGGHIHPPIEWVIAPSTAVVHHNSAGNLDYWMVPRTRSGVFKMVKVVPVEQQTGGTLVHDVADVKDYILTSSGGWIESSEGAVTSR